MNRRVVLGDAALTAVFLVVLLLEWGFRPIAGDGRGTPLWLGMLALVPMLFRRSYPAYAFVAGVLLVSGPSALHAGTHPWFYGTEVTLYVLLFSLVRRNGYAARWGWLAGPLVFLVSLPGDHDPADLLFDTVVFALAWLGGRTVRRFDLQGEELRSTLAELAAEREAREESAKAAERTRIAAEMHDVVAHAVSLMVVQVGATRIRLEKDGRSRAGLEAIEDIGRDALTDLRRMLGVLREVAR